MWFTTRKKPVSLGKATRPTLAGVLLHDRLFKLPERARESSVVWLTGPPGAGNTTLISRYLEHRKLPSLWYPIDEGDAERHPWALYWLAASRLSVAPRKSQLPYEQTFERFSARSGLPDLAVVLSRVC